MCDRGGVYASPETGAYAGGFVFMDLGDSVRLILDPGNSFYEVGEVREKGLSVKEWLARGWVRIG